MADYTAGADAPMKVEAEITPDSLKDLTELANKRGVDANVVLAQAIATEKLLSDNVGVNDEVLIKSPEGSYSKVLFSRIA